MKKNLREKFKTEVVHELMKKHDYKNQLQVPKLEKIVVNNVGSYYRITVQ